MIKSITLNPAIDKTIELESFNLNGINIVENSISDIAGKGINVSKAISKLGYETSVSGIIGKANASCLKNYLDKKNIPYHFLEVNGETRVNLKITDIKNGVTTNIDEKGLFISRDEIQLFSKMIFEEPYPQVMVFSGSIPPGVDTDIYKNLIRRAKSYGIKTILDADNNALIEGIKAAPNVVKPNIHELSRFFNTEIKSPIEVKKYGSQILNLGIETVVVSMGMQGAVFQNEEETIYIPPIDVKVRSTVGAGDTMVAVLALYLHENWSFEYMTKMAMAISAAAVATKGTAAPEKTQIEEMIERVKIERI